MYGWSLSCLAASLLLLSFYSPYKALALSGSDTTPSTTTTSPGMDIAGGSTASTTSQSTVQAQTNQSAANDPTPGSGSNQQQSDGSNSQTPPPTTQDNQNGTVTNDVNSKSQSGDATVAQSPVGGDATSGSSTASATLINTIASAAGPSPAPFQTSTDNITGNQTGDIAIAPPTTLNQNNQSTVQTPDNTPTAVQSTGTINNNVTLLAGSGNATVQNNGVGGNATTGQATADANLINLIDSTINDQQSFLDIINIFGNLTGNIVLPQSLIDALSAPNTAPNGGNGTNQQITNNFLINNQVTLLAQSGQAAVINNGNSGNATSGNATTNLVLYNLINSQINGGNLLLVLVNVLGTWTGLLLNEPAGTNTATLGSGVQDSSASQTAPVSSTSTETINNNLYLDAVSGDALNAYNAQGGNATSGNATSSADIVNILGDQINISGWLGILLINVFGSWNGSLVTARPASINNSFQGQSGNTTYVTALDANETSALTRHILALFTGPAAPTGANSDPIVLASAITGYGAGAPGSNARIISAKTNKSSQQNDSSFNFSVIEVLLMVLAVSLLIVERVISHRQSKPSIR